ncbi:MAG: HAMP domain-containing protein [Anaerolineales bacterium]|nr:HAMP domain-containing protein [Anaerolineales bacterium]
MGGQGTMIDRLRRATSSLQFRLTLTYTVVTVGALLALLILLSALLLLVVVSSALDESAYLQDVQLVLGTPVARYLAAGEQAALQAWADERYASGLASELPGFLLDSPAAHFVDRSPFYIIDRQGTVLAQAPTRTRVGQTVPLPETVDEAWFDLARSRVEGTLRANYTPLPDGNWFVVLPVGTEVIPRSEATVTSALVLTVTPAPSFLSTYFVLLGRLLLIASLLLLLGITPFGALFGYIMARGLTRRLRALEGAAAAWSRGDFDVVPEEHSRDEIGRLALRLREMAERLGHLLVERQEVAALAERNRLARELHDTVKQQNFATLMQLRAAKNLVQAPPQITDALARIDDAEQLLKQSQQDLATIIESLRPAEGEGQWLGEALTRWSEQWAARHAIGCQLQIAGEPRLSGEAQQALYRVAQEALSNVARHSGAQHVTLQLGHTPQRTTLTIRDDGRGFEVARVARGFGLSTMRQRIASLGGRFTLTSQIGAGTQIVIDLPTTLSGETG